MPQKHTEMPLLSVERVLHQRRGLTFTTHTTQQTQRTDEAVAPLLLQHLADVAHAADGELVVVELVS